MNKRLLVNIGKYLLAVGLLTWVVWQNWAPAPTKANLSLGVSSVGLAACPDGYGPLLAASAAVPGRTDTHGLGYVWQRHVVERQPIHSGFLLAGFALLAGAITITLLRWYLLVRALDLELSLRDALRFGMVGIFFNAFLPGSVGGDIVKAAALARHQSRRTAAVATVIMDRVIALWALIWFVAVLGSIFWATGLLQAGGAASFIITLTLVLVVVSLTLWLLAGLLPDHRAERFAGRLSRLRWVGPSAAEFWRSLWMYRRRQGSVAKVMALSWVGHVGFVLAFYCAANALWTPGMGPVPSVTEHFVLVPVGLVMQALIPTPGGAGGGEWVFAGLYVLFGAAEANGVLGSLISQRVFMWILGLAGYCVYCFTRASLPSGAEKDELPAPDLLPMTGLQPAVAAAGFRPAGPAGTMEEG